MGTCCGDSGRWWQKDFSPANHLRRNEQTKTATSSLLLDEAGGGVPADLVGRGQHSNFHLGSVSCSSSLSRALKGPGGPWKVNGLGASQVTWTETSGRQGVPTRGISGKTV